MRGPLIAGGVVVTRALTTSAWLTSYIQPESLPEPYVRPVVCAFPGLDFRALSIGMTESEIRRHFGERPVAAAATGCISYRYAPQLFDDSSPPLFITLLLRDGQLRAKWIQERAPDRTECHSGIARVVEVTDLMHEQVLASRRAAQR